MATYWENSCSFGLRYVSWYKYLIVNLVFSHLGFWSGNLFLIAPFPDLCLLVPFFNQFMWQYGIQSRKIVCGQARSTEPSTLQFTKRLAPSQRSLPATPRHVDPGSDIYVRK